jgi:hypothetical protein
MIALPQDLRALSFQRPWTDAILHAGKRVENRVKWSASSFRGWFLIHASKGWDKNALAFQIDRNLRWQVPLRDDKPIAGIVGFARVVDVIMPNGVRHAGEGHKPSIAMQHGPFTTSIIHPLFNDPWYMNAFALVLDDVRELPFIPCKGALGFFRPPSDVVTRVREEVARLA